MKVRKESFDFINFKFRTKFYTTNKRKVLIFVLLLLNIQYLEVLKFLYSFYLTETFLFNLNQFET